VKAGDGDASGQTLDRAMLACSVGNVAHGVGVRDE